MKKLCNINSGSGLQDREVYLFYLAQLAQTLAMDPKVVGSILGLEQSLLSSLVITAWPNRSSLLDDITAQG